MTAVLLVGTGQVGLRAARQLVDTPTVSEVRVVSRDPSRPPELADVMGERLLPIEVRPQDAAAFDGVDVVAVATDASWAAEWARAAIRAGVPAAVASDAPLDELDSVARAAGVAVVQGCALGPGMTDVLARHAADAFDVVDEVHVARVGAAGPACVEAVRAARRATPGEWRDGAWRTDRAFGPELVWFPEPVGARECQLVHAGVASAVTTVPTARHVTARLGAGPAVGRWRQGFGRDPIDQGWGAARVEVTGRREGAAGAIVYGMVDRTEVIAGVAVAVTAAALVGALDVGLQAGPGVHPLGASVAPVPFLTEIGRRGITAATFEGVVPH